MRGADRGAGDLAAAAPVGAGATLARAAPHAGRNCGDDQHATVYSGPADNLALPAQPDPHKPGVLRRPDDLPRDSPALAQWGSITRKPDRRGAGGGAVSEPDQRGGCAAITGAADAADRGPCA